MGGQDVDAKGNRGGERLTVATSFVTPESRNKSRRVRVGIDVGGTFTDAVIVDHETGEVVGQLKVPTTHRA